MKEIVKKLLENSYWLFILAINSILDIIEKICKTIRMIHISDAQMQLPIFQWDFIQNLIQVITVVILFLVLRKFNKTKEELIVVRDDLTYAKGEIENSNKHWFNQMKKLESSIVIHINDNDNILNKKINYLNFIQNHKDLTSDEFFTELKESGFSLEDLEEIKINPEFIKTHKDKLFPREVINAYNAYKIALYEHEQKTNTEK